MSGFIITSIGLTAHECSYRLGDSCVRSRFSSLAIAKHLDLKDYKVLLPATNAAHEKFADEIRKEFLELGIEVDSFVIPDGLSSDEISLIVKELVDRIPAGSEIVLDITQGLRHLPFVYLAALTYLVGLKNVDIKEIFNCPFELKDENQNVPVVKLTEMFELIEWYQALHSAKATGQLTQLSTQLELRVRSLFGAKHGDPKLSKARGALSSLSQALGAALPLEIGVYSTLLHNAVSDFSNDNQHSLTARLAVESLKDAVVQFKVPDLKKKSDFSQLLDKEELERQLRIARWYCMHDNVPSALLLLREWVVSFLMYLCGQKEWLNPVQGSNSVRHPWEAVLSAIVERSSKGFASDDEAKLASIWNQISGHRNRYAHAGMLIAEVDVNSQTLMVLMEQCEILLQRGLTLLNSAGVGEKILITPLGMSSGVLYSSLLCVKPDRAIIITSAEASAAVEAVLKAAGMPELPCTILVMQDPFAGFTEVKTLISEELESLLGNCSLAVVNITGGTTAMQNVVEKLWERAGRLGVNRRKIALVDRRPPVEQIANPYVAAEEVEIEFKRSALSETEACPVEV